VTSAFLTERARGNPLCRWLIAVAATRRIMRHAATDPLAPQALASAA
jgi:hypothetical protein